MPATIDLSGQRFGRLIALKVVARRPRKWLCSCDCGGTATVETGNLRTGNSTSCGCQAREATRERNAKHGLAKRAARHPLYLTWKNMRARCNTSSRPDFKHYGGRGIKVCERWNDFALFLADMGPRPDGLTLDRIDVNGNYEPGNCRWATWKEQRANHRPHKRRNKKERPRATQ